MHIKWKLGSCYGEPRSSLCGQQGLMMLPCRVRSQYNLGTHNHGDGVHAKTKILYVGNIFSFVSILWTWKHTSRKRREWECRLQNFGSVNVWEPTTWLFLKKNRASLLLTQYKWKEHCTRWKGVLGWVDFPDEWKGCSFSDTNSFQNYMLSCIQMHLNLSKRLFLEL